MPSSRAGVAQPCRAQAVGSRCFGTEAAQLRCSFICSRSSHLALRLPPGRTCSPSKAPLSPLLSLEPAQLGLVPIHADPASAVVSNGFPVATFRLMAPDHETAALPSATFCCEQMKTCRTQTELRRTLCTPAGHVHGWSPALLVPHRPGGVCSVKLHFHLGDEPQRTFSCQKTGGWLGAWEGAAACRFL